MNTIKDIARQVGVSAATVSNALNGRVNVSDEMRAKILAVAEKMNYVPNINAKLMKLRNTHNIGLFIPYLGGEFYNLLTKEIFERCVDAGYALLIHVSRNIDNQVLLANILSSNIDAAVVLSDRFSDEHIPLLETRGVPVVFLDRTFARKSVSSVVIDNESGIKKTVEYLAQTGHTKLAHLQGISNSYDAVMRRIAFIDTARACGLPVNPDWIIEASFSDYAAYSATRALMERAGDKRPDAFVCADDGMAMGCIHALRDMGLHVPRDISVTGFSSLQSSVSAPLALTSARYSLTQLCATAVQTLLDMLTGSGDGSIRRIDTQLIVGSTTAARGASLQA